MIRITRLTDYGILLLSRFAEATPGTVLSARELAEESGVPLPTVSKILKALTRGGLLSSHRGTQGGYSLARPSGAISVADVIEALEGPIALVECADDEHGDCNIAVRCPVRGNWQRVSEVIRAALEAMPLDEMTVAFPVEAPGLPDAGAGAGTS